MAERGEWERERERMGARKRDDCLMEMCERKLIKRQLSESEMSHKNVKKGKGKRKRKCERKRNGDRERKNRK
jgi:hypothetical protein